MGKGGRGWVFIFCGSMCHVPREEEEVMDLELLSGSCFNLWEESEDALSMTTRYDVLGYSLNLMIVDGTIVVADHNYVLRE